MIARSSPITIIAEVAQNHDGSLGQAHAFIDAVAETGATAIKFQTHIAEAESTPAEPFRLPFSYVDKTRYEYWKRMEFSADQWRGLKDHCTEKGLVFLSSPFSIEAIELLDSIGVPAWKIGSGEIGSRHMLRCMIETGKPIYLSTGMSRYAEIDGIVDFLRRHGATFTLLQCTTAYPSSFETAGLNVLAEFRRRYNCPVGLSDHSGTIFPCLAAATLGASLLEVHVTLSRRMFGPDVLASLTIEDLGTLVDGVRAIETMLDHPVDKDDVAKRMANLRQTFGKSATAARDLDAGHIVSHGDVTFKKPGVGLGEEDFEARIGCRLARAVRRGHLFSREDFE